MSLMEKDVQHVRRIFGLIVTLLFMFYIQFAWSLISRTSFMRCTMRLTCEVRSLMMYGSANPCNHLHRQLQDRFCQLVIRFGDR